MSYTFMKFVVVPFTLFTAPVSVFFSAVLPHKVEKHCSIHFTNVVVIVLFCSLLKLI